MVLISFAWLMSKCGRRGRESCSGIFCSSAAQSELNKVLWHPVCNLSSSFPPSPFPPISLSLFSLFFTLRKTKSRNTGIIFTLHLSHPFYFQHSFVIKTVEQSFIPFSPFYLLVWLKMDSFSWSCLTALLHCGGMGEIFLKNVLWLYLLLALGFKKKKIYFGSTCHWIRPTNWLSVATLSGFDH